MYLRTKVNETLQTHFRALSWVNNILGKPVAATFNFVWGQFNEIPNLWTHNQFQVVAFVNIGDFTLWIQNWLTLIKFLY